MRKVSAVLFDLDGTLLDRESSLLKFIGSQYDRFNHELSLIEKESYINRFIELDARGYVWKDKVYSQLLKEFNITGLTWEDLLEDYVKNFKHSCIGFPHLHEVLRNLRQMGIKLGLVSNGKTLFQMDNVKALGIEGFFHSILISEAVGLRKPDQRIFQKALDELGVKAAHSIFVGDHPENDVRAARDIGMVGIWKRDDYWEEAEADFIIEDLAELFSITLEGVVLYEQN
ncbi:HAD family hydrolase [Bacillus sp. ISL-35]|uniref:HAD family hydrolase n=1 Tax=Bacillus sp. ISL-35 TaxID=2819122 RepID=UPI001BE5ED0C|nr:HAD family hydrolase [Bacillus sp. ISL-35]MBT2678905.1 HAD family hydrolase [Bacillus sp. ISL-35]MBT2703901.1 HAD family hydrolase [Chryseobacterium sp. ISL-80]